MKILVTGSKGMLGQDLVSHAKNYEVEVIATTLKGPISLDVTSRKEILQALKKHKPDCLINCAAFTDVDGAEINRYPAYALNTASVGILAECCKEESITLAHISTDYVFGGNGKSCIPFDEDAAVSPCGVYGHSKHLGECLVTSILPQDSLIVRTSWLHGIRGKNFIDTIARLGKEKKEIRVVDDQFGSPTWTIWLSKILIKLIAKGAKGVFHACSKGEISWKQLAEEVVSLTGSKTIVKSQSTKDLGNLAPRPRWSVLSTKKLEEFLGETCPMWQETVAMHLDQIKDQNV